MDARLDPAKYAGLSEGDAHVIRNAGGRVMTLFAPSNFAQTFRNSGLLFIIQIVV
jgi:carbonic anhydrase